MINKKVISFIIFCIFSVHVNGQTEDDRNENLKKRISFFGFSTTPETKKNGQNVPETPLFANVTLQPGLITPLPPFLTTEPKYQGNNDLLQILSLFTNKQSADAIVNEFWHNTPTIESCLGCNILVKHLKGEYANDEAGFQRFFFSVCELFKVNGEDNGEFCSGFTQIYATQLIYIFENSKLSSEEICASLLTDCLDHFHWYKSPLFWEIKLSEQLPVRYNSSSSIKAYMTPRNTDNSKENETIDEESQKRATLPIPIAQPIVQPIVQPVARPVQLPSQPVTPPSYNYNDGKLFSGARFLHLSDIHLDLLYSLHSNSYCGRILCCRMPNQLRPNSQSLPHAQPISPVLASNQSKNPKLRLADPSGSYYANMYAQNQTITPTLKGQAGYWGSYGNCDLPLRTIKHMLRHLANFNDQIDYVIWSGDSISHNIWSTEKKQVIETNAILTKLIVKYLLSPKKAASNGTPYQPAPGKLVPVIGNHESDVVSMFPSTLLQNHRFSIDWLYRELYQQWRAFIPADQAANFLRGGYYSVVVARNMKLIVLNTNACYRLNFWTLAFSSDMDGQLLWLERELNTAEAFGQNVHLIGHIAPDVKNCNAVWLHNFIRIVARYQQIIKAQFYGHSHLDEVKIYYGNSWNQNYNLREIEELHKKQNDESQIDKLLEDIKNNSSKMKRIVNSVAEQQIKQLSNLESLRDQLQHLNKDVLFKTGITMNEKINGFYNNPGLLKEVKIPISIAFLAPSATPYDDVNPAYKVFIVDDSGTVANAKVFYADIEEANRNHAVNWLKSHPVQPTQKRNTATEETDPMDEEDELSESENRVSYNYALPNEADTNYQSYRSITGNQYAQASAPKVYPSAGGHYSKDYHPQQVQPIYPNPVYREQKPSVHLKEKTGKTKTNDYTESTYNAKLFTHDQSAKTSSKNYQLDQQTLYHPVFEKYSVQPQSSKKYFTNQNSYQAINYQTKPYQVSGQQSVKTTGQYPVNDQPKSNYSPKPYQQQPANYQTSYPTVSNSGQTKPALNYPTNKNELYNSNNKNRSEYTQSTAYNYKPLYELPGDIDYDLKQYDHAKSYGPNMASKSSPKTESKQSNHKPVYQSNSAQNYAALHTIAPPKQVINYQAAPQNYSKSNLPNYQSAPKKENKPTVLNTYYAPKPEVYSMPQNYSKSASINNQNSTKPIVYSTPKPPQNYSPSSNYKPEIKPAEYEKQAKTINYPTPKYQNPIQSSAHLASMANHLPNYAPKVQPVEYNKPAELSKPPITMPAEYKPSAPQPIYQNLTRPAYQNSKPNQSAKPVEYNRPTSKPVEYHVNNYSTATSQNKTQQAAYQNSKSQSNYQSAPNYRPNTRPIEYNNPVEKLPMKTYANYDNRTSLSNYQKLPAHSAPPKYTSAIPPKLQSANQYSAPPPNYVAKPQPQYHQSSLQPQPIRHGYEYWQYELANEYIKQLKPPVAPIASVQPSTYPIAPVQPPHALAPVQLPHAQVASVQPSTGLEYGLVYENVLGNQFPLPANKIYPTEHDLKLMKANEEFKELKWRFAYDINAEYAIARSTPFDWVNFINLLRTDNVLFSKYYSNLHRRSGAARWRIECNEMCKQHLLDEVLVVDPLVY